MQTIGLDLKAHQRDHWTAGEKANVEAAAEFVQLLMIDHNFEAVRSRFGGNHYVQHNRNMSDGIAGVIEYVDRLVRRYPDYTYDVKHISVDGDLVTFHSHATLRRKDRGDDRQGFNIFDTWRVVDGKIVEHWDALQPLNSFMRFYAWMVGGSIRNTNGVF